jgi:hypothetical protein
MNSLQTITLDFEVQGALDGLTPAPAFTPDPVALAYRRPSSTNQIFPVIVEGDLGLIDPDYVGSNGSMGDRFLQRLEIQAAAPGIATASVSVVDARGALVSIVELERIADLPAATLYYRDACVFFPQGSMLQISGFPAGANSHQVRVHFVGAESAEGEALLAQMCCCEEIAQIDPTIICAPPTIDDVSPVSVTAGTGLRTLVLTGSGFTATDVIIVTVTVPPDPTDLVDPGSFVFVNSGQIQCEIDTNLTAGGAAEITVLHGGDPDCTTVFPYTIDAA